MRASQYGAVAVIVVAFWMAKATAAQDYPQYTPAGSTWVPLDSWVYPALERLGAMGYVTTSLEGMKPWTRTECARLTQDAGDALLESVQEDRKIPNEGVRLQKVLEREFAFEIEAINGGSNRSVRLESVYARALSISGPALTDGFHFGQTVGYDFGRPFQRGFNAITGGAVRATAGPFAVYVRAEYQHAPGAPALSSAVRSFIAAADLIPAPSGQAFPAINRVALLEAYASVNVKNWIISFGRQTIAWGPDEDGGLLLSDNAPALPMLRVSRALPRKLPWLLKKLGPIRSEYFIARLEGANYIGNPLIWGHKFSIKVGRNVELGWGRTNILGAGSSHLGDPFTFKNLIVAVFGRTSVATNGGVPGDSRNSLDLYYYVPKTHHALTLYGDFFAEDAPVYFRWPDRGAYKAGFFLARVPGISKLDFRAESTSTDSPGIPTPSNYWNSKYRDGYTSSGMLLGDLVGRQGRAIRAWTTYHFSPTHLLELSFEHRQVNPALGVQNNLGELWRWQDYELRHQYYFRSGMYVKSRVQFEHIANLPLLFSGKVNNVMASVEVGFAPEQGKWW